VSHETIYRSLFVQARGVLKKELLQHLRSKRTIRRSRRMDQTADRRGKIANMVSIRDRPAAAEIARYLAIGKAILLSGSKNSHIATLVERHTRYVMLAKVDSKETQAVGLRANQAGKKLPNELYKSLTWDQGKELADHRQFTMATDIDVYFCDPSKPMAAWLQ